MARRHANALVGNIRWLFTFGVPHELVPAGVLGGLRGVAPLAFGHTTAKESEPRDAMPDHVFEATMRHLSATVRAMLELMW